MASTLVSNQGKQVWIHNASLEIAFEHLSGDKRLAHPENLISFRLEIEAALANGWIDGLAASFCETYLSDSASKKAVSDSLLSLVKMAEHGVGEVFHLHAYCAQRQMLIAETTKMTQLLESPDDMPAYAEVYAIDTGKWVLA